MGCKRDKDMSRCVASCKLYIPDSRHFWTVYLWDSVEALAPCSDREEATAEYAARCEEAGVTMTVTGACCHMPEFQRHEGGQWVAHRLPKLGELHFVKDIWNLEIVAHECRHTESSAHAALGIPLPNSEQHGQDINAEEDACYYLGGLIDNVYRWLWQVNPHGQHAGWALP
jgi:hypothetical protein